MMACKHLCGMLCVGALAFALGGCAKHEQGMQSQYRNQEGGTAMVREMGEHGTESAAIQCQNKMTEHLGKADSTYDERFIDMMITHHQGAINMAKDAMAKAQHPEIREMAEDIIEDQQEEINKLEAWHKAWYGATAQR